MANNKHSGHWLFITVMRILTENHCWLVSVGSQWGVTREVDLSQKICIHMTLITGLL